MFVVVLNLDNNPLNIVSWQRAIVLVLKKKVDVIEYYNEFIHDNIKKPKIIKLRKFIYQIYNKKPHFTRRHIFLRDNYICQYCGKKLNNKTATIDHIFPISLGGKDTYKNCVTSCFSCNIKKGSRLLKDTNMKLSKTPKEPNYFELLRNKIKNI